MVASLVPRNELFLTTKGWVTEHTYEKTRSSVTESMEKLQIDHLDLVLIHQPLSDYFAACHALEDLYHEGKLRAIGISNFSPERMVDLATFTNVVPAVNQVETHLFFQQEEAHLWMEKYKVQHEAWGPLAEHRFKELLNDPLLEDIAKAHLKTPAQIALRSQVQRGIVVIPKTVSKDRMKENIDIFDFVLSGEEMNRIRTLMKTRAFGCPTMTPKS